MGWVKPSVSGTSFVAKSESKDQVGALNVPNELASFGKAGLPDGGASRRAQNSSFHLSLWHHQASGSSSREVDNSILLSGDLQKPGPGPSTDDALSTNLLHPLPNLSFPHVELCQATGLSRTAVLTVGKQAHFLLRPAVAFVLFLEASLHWRTRKSC